MPFTKEQLKAYYEANRLKLNQQRSERRRLARLGQINHSEVETILGIGLRQVETLDNINQVETKIEVRTGWDNKEVETATNLNLESYNAEVYKRASFLTKDPKAFFTFPDGRKIIRTKCGCNPTKDFYDWCLDSCQYFTNWRNSQKPWTESWV